MDGFSTRKTSSSDPHEAPAPSVAPFRGEVLQYVVYLSDGTGGEIIDLVNFSILGSWAAAFRRCPVVRRLTSLRRAW